MEETIYQEMKDYIIYSQEYTTLSDKTDHITGKSRSINTYILANLAIGFSKEFGLNQDLAELIVCARDIVYPSYGEIACDFFKKKDPSFDLADYTIEFLEKEIFAPRNLTMPDEVKRGIYSSFNIGNDKIKEGRLVYLLERTIYTAQMKVETVKYYEGYLKKLDNIWTKLEKEGVSTPKEIISKMLLLTDSLYKDGE